MRILMWITFVLAVAAYICGPLDDPDLWWHITIGRWIIAHGTVPHVDYWTLFGNGQPWRAYSWSIEILFASIEQYSGLFGLMVAKIVMTLMLAFSAQYVFVRLSRSLGFGSLLAIICVLSCFNHITLRPQTFIWILFIWVLYYANCIATLEPGARGHAPSRFVPLGVIMCMWANIHISAILGLGLIFLWLARPGSYEEAVKAMLAGFVGTLFTPYFGGEWLTFLSTSSHPFSFAAISEFQPATILQYSSAFPALMVVSIAAVVATGHGKQSNFRWFLAGGFLIGSLAVIKFLPFAMVVFCGLLAIIWADVEDKARVPLLEGFNRFIALVERVPREGLSFVFICLAIVYLKGPLKSPLNYDITPVSTMDFFQQRNLPFPLLNPFGQGGYIMYRLSDQGGNLSHLPSIDGRTNLITKELWDMHGNALQGSFGWEKYIEAVKPKTILWKAESPLTSILRNNSQWCHVFLAGDYKQGFALFLERAEFEQRKDQLKADNC